ncbi:Do family serine endopeptidase [Pelagibacterium sp. 26DY04]|uniref:Do family serine endopeptidase n=1 Tax=Pelagibacterium sp. 26DY04 TaxID=2967130 RepID=UPI00281677C2|nr:Do family serine endopeptidase [Pelagibacterium sp. 26DY04]WMT85384.1 Do family serine endopeptidase [Pelagibacterium sp. 26DY04]
MFRQIALAVLIAATPFAASAQVERQVPQTQEQIQLSYAPIVSQVAPAVVNVYATRVEEQRITFRDPFFDRFFGRSPLFETRPQTSQSLGSGVIVSAEGMILTNNHVVEGATDIRVVANDGREYPVELILADAATDLAVLRIEDADRTFPTVQFADSDQLEVGDLVLAIGNPFGVGQSVSSGIVSALARTGMGITDYQFFIQTDAAINPGNSGGALVDMNGNLVGINTAIFTRSGGSQGIGFAIPSNMARVIAAAGEAGGEITRPWLGAQMQALDGDLAASLGLDTPRGALITEVAPDSPAELAGLASGDVVTMIDGVQVQDPEALNYRIATKAVGSTAQVTLWRDGAEMVASLPLNAPPPVSDRQVTISGNTRFAGTVAAELNPALAQELGLGFSIQGIAVIEVEQGSPADRMGLQEGDVILALNGMEIRDIETFESLASQRPRAWQIILQRGGNVVRSVVSG